MESPSHAGTRRWLEGAGSEQVCDKKACVVAPYMSPEVIEHFRSTGAGWQSRIDETLRKAVKRKAS
jgi:uncharacterized protein (DUF4415 family)